ncbi:MAG: hypothetical protein ACYC9J_12200 [Sulfuricaulis sp.]
MKRYVLWAVLAVFLMLGPVGCGKREIADLNAKVTQLQMDLASAKEQLADKSKEADDLTAKANQLQTTVDTQTADIVKLKAELDKLEHHHKKKVVRRKRR